MDFRFDFDNRDKGKQQIKFEKWVWENLSDEECAKLNIGVLSDCKLYAFS